MTRIHAFTTGTARIRQSQIISETQGGAREILNDSRWSDWLPITAWLIEHPEGLILVDTGETSRTMDPGYLPRWHPYYRRAVEFNVQPHDEIGPQLRQAGFSTDDVRHVVLTHLHTDHAGGLYHFPESTIWVDQRELQAATGLKGRMLGYLNHRWPEWFDPHFYGMNDGSFATFDESTRLTDDGAVSVVPTPGHSTGHVSVIVQTAKHPIILAGDASYTDAIMRAEKGGATLAAEGFDSLRRLHQFVEETGALYLPTHEAGVAERLIEEQSIQVQLAQQ